MLPEGGSGGGEGGRVHLPLLALAVEELDAGEQAGEGRVERKGEEAAADALQLLEDRLRKL